MSELPDLITTTLFTQPKKRGPKPKTTEEKEAIKIERKIKKKEEKEEQDKKYKEWIEANPYEYKKRLYEKNKLPKNDPDYAAIHENSEKIKQKIQETYESLYKPVPSITTLTTVLPIKKYKSQLDEFKEVMKVVKEEEDEEKEKERKKQEKMKKMIKDEEDAEAEYKKANKKFKNWSTSHPEKMKERRDIFESLFAKPKKEPENPVDIISIFVEKNNQENNSNTGKGGKKRNTKKNKKTSKRKSKRNRVSKRRM